MNQTETEITLKTNVVRSKISLYKTLPIILHFHQQHEIYQTMLKHSAQHSKVHDFTIYKAQFNRTKVRLPKFLERYIFFFGSLHQKLPKLIIHIKY